METVNPTLAMGGCASRYYPGGKLGSEHNIDYQAKIAAGHYGKWSVMKGPSFFNGSVVQAAEALKPFEGLDPDEGDHVLGCFPDGGYNMPYRGVDSSYDQAHLTDRGESKYDSMGNVISIDQDDAELGHAYASELLAGIPKMKDLVKKAIEFLGKDDNGFFMVYEQGDIDWAAHGDHMDDMLGTMLDIDDSVQEIMTWIDNNGGYEKNALYVTADHDHHLTLKPNFPSVLAHFLIAGESHKITPARTTSGGYEGASKMPSFYKGAEVIHDPTGVKSIKELQTWPDGTIDKVGHFWGAEEDGGNAWGSHTNMPVPVSYQGDTLAADGQNCIDKLKGTGFTVAGKEVRGSPGKIDQIHLHACMFKALMGY